MPTIKCVILKRVDKSGNTQVQIAITNKGKTAYIPTGIKCKPTDWKNGRIKNNNSANAELLAMVNGYEAKLNDIECSYNLPAITIKDILVNAPNRDITLIEYIGRYADTKNEGTQKIFNSLKLVVSKFIENRKYRALRLADLTNYHIKEFFAYLNSEKSRRGIKYSNDTIRINIDKLKQVLKQANKENLCSSVDVLFADISTPENVVRRNTISIDTFNYIRNMELDGRVKPVARDMFVLSFYLGGMNIVDMLRLDFRKDIITYTRQKARESSKESCKETISIFPQAREIINRYMNINTGMLSIDLRYDRVSASLNLVVEDLKKRYETDEYITFYSARKLFATLGTNLGISDSVIDYILGHSNKKRGMISHYSSIMPDLAEEAMRIIFEFADNPEDLKEIFRRNILKNIRG